MKLSSEQKKTLLQKAKLVYGTYLSLDWFKSHAFTIDGQLQTLFSFFQQLRLSGEIEAAVTINGQACLMTLEGDSCSLKGIEADEGPGGAPLKLPNNYSDDEILKQLTQQKFDLQTDAHGKVSVSTLLEGALSIGGPGKIDLYRTHLVTLYNIIEKIESEEDISHLLVALATGSGKTFVQALWMLVLSMAEFDAIFSTPDQLVAQFHKDIKGLLPEVLTDKILTLRNNEPSVDAQQALETMGQGQREESQLIIASSERLLDRHYQAVCALNPDDTFLSFDEQHLLTGVERRRARWDEISKKILSMFLTATPSEKTYTICGKRAVAMMSSGQKEKAGQGKFPTIVTHHAKQLSEKLPFATYNPFKKAFWKTLGQRFMIWFYNAVIPEQTSAARSFIEALPYFLVPDPKGHGHQVPMARKMLVIVDENESLVNLFDAIDPYGNRSKIYHDGDFVDRTELANFFGTYDVEQDARTHYQKTVRDAYRNQLRPQEAALERIAETGVHAQMCRNVFHNLIEYVLSDLTGLSEIEHNQLRKDNPERLENLVKDNLNYRDSDYYFDQLKEKLDENGARQVAKILAKLSETLQVYGWSDESKLSQFVTNNALNNPLYDDLLRLRNLSDLKENFLDFTQTHLVIGMMSGMAHAEMPVQDSKAFFMLDRETYSLYDNDGMLSKKAKRRKRDPIKILDPNGLETRFEASYLEGVTEEHCDNYFRLGFMGMYISNKKTEGFNDVNLQTVAMITEDPLSKGSHPEKLIQGLGRNRGLDETQEPVCIHALGSKQTPPFDLNHLKKDDYYPELFKSVRAYRQRYLAVLGEKIGSDLINWFERNLDQRGKLHSTRLKRQVLKQIAVTLRQLNNENHHNIQLSRKHLKVLLSHAMRRFDREIAYLEKPYQLSFFVRCVGSILNFLAEGYYAWGRMKAAFKRYAYRWFQQKEPAGGPGHQAEITYDKIIRKTSFKTLTAKSSVLNEFKQWTSKLKAISEIKVLHHLSSYLKAPYSDQLKGHFDDALIPFFVKFVVSKHSAQVRQALSRDKALLARVKTHQDQLERLESEDPRTQALFILRFLQDVPGLEHLTQADLSDYPQRMVEFKEKPLQTVLQGEDVREALAVRLVDYMQGSFPQHLTSFFTYPDALKIKEKLEDRASLKAFAKRYLDTMIDGETEFSIEHLLEKFSDHMELASLKTIEGRVQEAKGGFQDMIQTLQTNEQAGLLQQFSAFSEQIPTLGNKVREFVLPVLATCIKKDEKKAWFLSRPFNNQQLAGWLNRNRSDFEQSETFGASNALKRINQLLPEGEKLTEEEMCDPRLEAEQSQVRVQENFSEALMASVVESTSCKKTLTLLFNEKDHDVLWRALQEKGAVYHLVKTELLGEDFQIERLLQTLKQADPECSEVQDLHERLKQAQDFLMDFNQNQADRLDGAQVATTVHQMFSPLLYHPQFYNTIYPMIGYLNEDDITMILRAKSSFDSRTEAKALTTFIQAVGQKDQELIEKNYFSSNQAMNSSSLDGLPILDVIGSLVAVVEEVIECHCYYNDHNEKGGSYHKAGPALLHAEGVSDTLKNIRIKETHSPLSHLSRMVFFLNGLRNGLSDAAQVNSDINQYKVRRLKEVRQHILQPIQEGVSLSKFERIAIDSLNGLARLCKDVVSWIWKGINYPFSKEDKQYANKVAQSKQRADDFQSNANSFTQVMNQLTPFEPEDVREATCPKDVIHSLKPFWAASRPEENGLEASQRSAPQPPVFQ